MNEWDTKLNLCIIIFIILIKKIIITSTLYHNHLYLLIKFIVTHTTTTTILHKMKRCDVTCIWTMHQLSTKHRNYSCFIKCMCVPPKYGWCLCFTVRSKIFSPSIQDNSFYLYQYQNFLLNNFYNEHKWRLNERNSSLKFWFST